MASEPTELKLHAAIRSRILRHGERAYPEEACGGLLGLRQGGCAVDVMDAVPLANASEGERRRRYLIGPDDVLGLERRADVADLMVVGYYHSHPDAPASPSSADREHAWPGYIYLIVSVEKGQTTSVRAWQLAEDRGDFKAVRLKARRTEDARGSRT
jgi:proteasome lid subunit RPN8/RPN11